MKNYSSRAGKVQKRIMELALFTDDEHSINRLFGTKSFIECSYKIAEWMYESGLQTHIDNMGNVRGRLLSENINAKTFVIGSHFDTAINSGKFDGPIGIICGLDLVDNIISQKLSLPFNIEIIAFSEEEGTRFHEDYLGSKVVAGSFDNHSLDKKDDEGYTLEEVLHSMKLDAAKIESNKMPEDSWLGYLEIHIEEGPVLYEKNIAVGTVNAIAGQRRIEINFEGEAGHAGAVPMNMRRDALCAAAQFLLGVEEYASHEKRNIVATVSKINVPNAVFNAIPGSANCTLDLRSADAESLSDAYESIYKMCEDICMKRKIYCEWKLIFESNPVVCDKPLNILLGKAIRKKNIELVSLVSGVGNDAVIISQVAPVAVLFVKCFKGFSHHSMENVEIEDIAIVLEVGDHFLKQLANVKI